MDTQLYEKRTIHLLEGNDMTTLIAIAVLAFVIYCFMAEANCSPKNSPAIVTILCRLVARHIKLALKLLVGPAFSSHLINGTIGIRFLPPARVGRLPRFSGTSQE
jgi:hypothetical protein